MERNNKGHFVAGNKSSSAGGKARARKLSRSRRREIARQGWQALVDQRFMGDANACKTWCGRMGAWHSDEVYRAAGLGHMAWPGTINEFCNRFWQLNLFSPEYAKRSPLDFKLDDLQPLAF